MSVVVSKKKLGKREVDTSYLACNGNKITLKRNDAKQPILCKVHTTCAVGQELISQIRNQFTKAKAKANDAQRITVNNFIKTIGNNKTISELEQNIELANLSEMKNKIESVMKAEAMAEIRDVKFPVYVYFDTNNAASLKAVKGYIIKIMPDGCMCQIKTDDNKHEFKCSLSKICFDKTCAASNNNETDINFDRARGEKMSISVDIINKLADSVSKTLTNNINVHAGGSLKSSEHDNNNNGANVVNSQEFECD